MTSLTREENCDPIWDGALFGVLPGIGVSVFMNAFSFCGETADDDCGSRLAIGGIAGAGVGLLLDELHCAETSPPDGMVHPARSRIRFDPEFRFTALSDSTAGFNSR